MFSVFQHLGLGLILEKLDILLILTHEVFRLKRELSLLTDYALESQVDTRLDQVCLEEAIARLEQYRHIRNYLIDCTFEPQKTLLIFLDQTVLVLINVFWTKYKETVNRKYPAYTVSDVI